MPCVYEVETRSSSFYRDQFAIFPPCLLSSPLYLSPVPLPVMNVSPSLLEKSIESSPIACRLFQLGVHCAPRPASDCTIPLPPESARLRGTPPSVFFFFFFTAALRPGLH